MQVQKVLLKAVTDELLSNKPEGMDVNKVQFLKQCAILFTIGLLSNKPEGIEAIFVPIKQNSKFVTSGQLSNKPEGMDVNEVQFPKQP